MKYFGRIALIRRHLTRIGISISSAGWRAIRKATDTC